MAYPVPSNASSPGFQQMQDIRHLTEQWNAGELDWLPEKDKEQIAMLAAQYGQDFKPGSKPVKKALFDFFDMASFGLLPDKWRAKSVGEDYFGESSTDKWAGGLGTIGGLVTPYGGPRLLMKGAGKAGRGVKNWWQGGGSGVGGAGGTFSSAGEKALSYSKQAGERALLYGREAGEKALSYSKQRGASLWEMTTEQGNRLRSTILNNQYYKTGAPKVKSAYDQGMSYGSDFLSRGREFSGY